MRLKIEPEAAIVASLVYYFYDWTELTAVAAAITVHELGHLATLKLLGLNVCSLKAELGGICISYRDGGGTAVDIIAAAAGPLAGILYALGASRVFLATGERWLAISGGLSFILSAFNLLPIMPLDGGRILSAIFGMLFNETRAAEAARVTGLLCAAALFVWGVYRLALRRDVTVYAAGAWLLVLCLRDTVKA